MCFNMILFLISGFNSWTFLNSLLKQDQVLLGMQQKLDDLCMQMSTAVDWPMKSNNKMHFENDAPSCLKLPELNPESGITPLFKNSLDKPKV